MHFFPCLNSFCMLCGITFFLNCIISGMFSMTCSLVALSLIAKWMIKSSFCCLSLLAHRIINAWHYSGPDLQSAPTPWMLDASFPLEAFNCFWLALPAWFVDARLALMCVCGGGDGGLYLWRLSYLCKCATALSQPRLQYTVKYMWHCGYYSVCTNVPQYLLWSSLLLFPPCGSNLEIFSTQI